MEKRVIIKATREEAQKAFDELEFFSVRYMEEKNSGKYEMNLRFNDVYENNVLNLRSIDGLFSLEEKAKEAWEVKQTA